MTAAADGPARGGSGHLLSGLAVGCLAVATFVWLLGPQVDFDLWFDLRLGEHIVRTRTIPHQVMFLSTGTDFSMPHAGDDEWGFTVLAWEVWQAGGDTGLAFLKASIILAIGAAIWGGCRAQGMAPLPAALWAFTMLVMMRSRFMLRPQLFTDLFVAVLVLLLVRRDRLLPWLMVPLFGVWSNVHPGVFGGLGVITLWTIGTLVFARDDVRAVSLACALAWLSAWLLTPVDIFASFHTVLMEQRKSIALIVEWAPLTWSALTWAYWAFAALYLFGFGTAALRRRLDPRALAIVTALAVMTVRHCRTVGELGAASALMAGAVVDGWQWLRPRRLPAAAPTVAALIVVVASTVALGLDVRQPDRFDFSPPADVYPLGAVDVLLADPPTGALFDSYHFGGYLAWRGFRPFIHGMNSHYKEELFEQYLAILGDADRRPALLDKFGIGACLLAYPQGRDTHKALIEWLAQQPDWHLVHWDDVSLLYVKGPTRLAPYVAVNPALDRPLLSADDAAVERELTRAGEASPRAAQPRLLRAELRMRQKNPQAAADICTEVIAAFPTLSTARLKRGVARFQLGEVAGAIGDLREAVRLAPESAVARFDLALACVTRARDLEQRHQPDAASADVAEARASLHEALSLDPQMESATKLLDAIGR